MVEKSGTSLTQNLQAAAKTKLHEQIVDQVLHRYQKFVDLTFFQWFKPE